MVRHARRQRRIVDGGLTDWIVVRNRLALLGSRNKKLVGECLDRLGLRLGFRADRRLLRARGVPRVLPARADRARRPRRGDARACRPNLSHLTARQEVRALIEALKLPIDEKGRAAPRRAPNGLAAQDKPLDIDDLIDGEPAATRAIAPRGRDATL